MIPSASPRTTWSAPSYEGLSALVTGPPTTVRNPAFRQRAISCAREGPWTSMALRNATSAQAMSLSRSSSTLRSTSFRSQCGGSIAETVSNPRGG